MNITFIIDFLIYGLLLVTLYIAFNKIFARSNVGYVFIVVFVTKVIASLFDLNTISSLADVILMASFISIVVSNEQKINKLLKRKKSPKSKQNNSQDRKQLYKIINTTLWK